MNDSLYMFQWSRRYLKRGGDQTEFGARRETGEIHMLSKKERVLTIEVLKLTLAAPARRQVLIERFGKEDLEIAASLLGQMGVKVVKAQEQKPGKMP